MADLTKIKLFPTTAGYWWCHCTDCDFGSGKTQRLVIVWVDAVDTGTIAFSSVADFKIGYDDIFPTTFDEFKKQFGPDAKFNFEKVLLPKMTNPVNWTFRTRFVEAGTGVN